MVSDIDKKRALYHYYKNKDDLLSKCQAEVLHHELQELKRNNEMIRKEQKLARFLSRHPEYSNLFNRR